MPLGDGTGPMGMGPMTGRGAGYCAGYGVPGYMNPIAGRGFWGRGGGWGRGWAYGTWPAAPYATVPWGWPQPTQEQQRDALEQQARMLRTQLEAVEKKLDELKQDDAEAD